MKPYLQQLGKVAHTDDRFEHVMAVSLNPQTKYMDGVIRCITKREGAFGIRGSLDTSVLHTVHAESLEKLVIGGELHIEGMEEAVAALGGEAWDFIGLEDPDIWIDPMTNKTHLYFTIALIAKDRAKHHSLISLGHAEGESLDTLMMTEPVLTASEADYENHKAKEVCIAPINKQGVRLNLIESGTRERDDAYGASTFAEDTSFSTVRIAIAQDMGKPWQWGETAFHPGEHAIPWIAEHASPGPLLPKSFIDVGEGKMLGIMNGREKSEKVAGEIRYRMFSVGLFIYDYENGKIDWVSPEPLIRDSEAESVTFASQFIETTPGEGILYAHVDDSFVRAYTLFAEGIRPLLPKTR